MEKNKGHWSKEMDHSRREKPGPYLDPELGKCKNIQGRGGKVGLPEKVSDLRQLQKEGFQSHSPLSAEDDMPNDSSVGFCFEPRPLTGLDCPRCCV